MKKKRYIFWYYFINIFITLLGLVNLINIMSGIEIKNFILISVIFITVVEFFKTKIKIKTLFKNIWLFYIMIIQILLLLFLDKKILQYLFFLDIAFYISYVWTGYTASIYLPILNNKRKG